MRYFLLLSLFLCTVFCFAQKKKSASPFVRPLPVPNRTVNDFGKFLDASEAAWLEKELVAYYERTGNAIVFISLNTLTDPKTKKEYTIEEAALLYFNKWGIGDSIKNNGVLLMVSREPRRVRIEVGTGLETMLPNSSCQRIINVNLVPNFKQGLFFMGIKEAVEAIKKLLDEQQAAVVQQASSSSDPFPSIVNTPDQQETSTWEIWVGLLLGGSIMWGLFRFAWFQARRMGGWFTGSGYNNYRRRGYYNNSFNNNNNTNNFFSSGGGGGWSSGGSSGSSSGGGSSSSSSSSSSGSYGGGQSSGGGASGSW